jgi:hypothetical protein
MGVAAVTLPVVVLLDFQPFGNFKSGLKLAWKSWSGGVRRLS